VQKLDLFSRAKVLISRGWPPIVVARDLGVSRQTLLYWRSLMDYDHAFASLRRRALLLPEHLRDRLVTDLTESRRAA
jgi:hypothetical protein